MTEQTQQTDQKGRRGWVLYDGDCPVCVRSIKWLAVILHHRGFNFAPLQTPWVRLRVGLREGERPKEMLVLTGSDVLVGGADAVVFLVRRIWWAWPMCVVARLPGAMPLLRKCYRWVARHRPRASETQSLATSFVNDTREPSSKATNQGE